MSEIFFFPIVFFDGKRERDAGTIRIDPSFRFKKFESVIRRKIRVPRLPISICFVCWKSPNSTTGSCVKIPIHDNLNFATIAHEKGGHFYVEVKTSNRAIRENAHWDLQSGDFKLLRRDPMSGVPEFGKISPFAGEGFGLPSGEYEKHTKELQRNREEYLMYRNLQRQQAPEYVDYTPRTAAVCEECMGAKERPVPFHSCVYDSVTRGFRSKAGPIQRPSEPKTGS